MPQQYRSSLLASVAFAGLLTSASVNGTETLKFSPKELKVLYKAAGLTERGRNFLDACEQPVHPETEVVDLNKDGQPEVFVQVGSPCYGAAGAQLSLLVKDKFGQWQSNFDFLLKVTNCLTQRTMVIPILKSEAPFFAFQSGGGTALSMPFTSAVIANHAQAGLRKSHECISRKA